MYTKRIIEPEIIWYFSWRPLLYTTALSSAVYVFYHLLNIRSLPVPFLPIATVGTAVAFYVGFKNNSSYDRLWEARKIWGEITNSSRAMNSYLIALMRQGAQAQELKAFVYRQIAYVNLLRLQLRKRNVWDSSYEYTRMSKECFNPQPFELAAKQTLETYFSSDESSELLAKHNIASEIAHRQLRALVDFKQNGWIDSYEHSDLVRICNDLYVQQGKAERIKSFPFPRQYAFFSEVFVNIFVSLLPFGLIGEFAKISPNHEWLTIPFSVLISWVFITMEKVGDTSENPFEESLNDVPMTTICRSIEIDLRGLLGETDLPEPLKAVDHILM